LVLPFGIKTFFLSGTNLIFQLLPINFPFNSFKPHLVLIYLGSNLRELEAIEKLILYIFYNVRKLLPFWSWSLMRNCSLGNYFWGHHPAPVVIFDFLTSL